MGDIHFNVFSDDFLKRIFRHFSMAAKASFRYRELVKRSCPWKYLTDNVREIVQSLKQVFMNLLKSLGRTDFHGVENTGIKQPVGIIQTCFVNFVFHSSPRRLL